jgi:hypothetical protein
MRPIQTSDRPATAGVEIKEHLCHILLASTYVPMSPSNTTERELSEKRIMFRRPQYVNCLRQAFCPLVTTPRSTEWAKPT